MLRNTFITFRRGKPPVSRGDPFPRRPDAHRPFQGGQQHFQHNLLRRANELAAAAAGDKQAGVSAAAGLAALSGLQVVHFWGSLVLLGLGWNLSFVGATAIIAGSYRPAERAKVQAANDFLVFATVAVASLSAGYLLAENSWQQLNQIILPVVAAVVVVLVSCRRAVGVSSG